MSSLKTEKHCLTISSNGKMKENNLLSLNNRKFRESAIRYFKRNRAGKRSTHALPYSRTIVYSNSEKSSSLKKITGIRSANVCRTQT